MPTAALALALGSAVLHAAWNLLLARARDVQAAAAATFLLSVALAAPFAAVWWSAQPSVWPYALASTLLETVYVVALAAAYRTTDLSFVYPLTRGLAPVLTLGAAVLLLGHGATVVEVAGVFLVAAGVVLARGPSGHGDGRALLWMAAIAASIAAYTLVDRVGIHRAGALTYFVLVLAGPCLAYLPLVGWSAVRRELGAGGRARGPREHRLVRPRAARAPPRSRGAGTGGSLVLDRDRDTARPAAPRRGGATRPARGLGGRLRRSGPARDLTLLDARAAPVCRICPVRLDTVAQKADNRPAGWSGPDTAAARKPIAQGGREWTGRSFGRFRAC